MDMDLLETNSREELIRETFKSNLLSTVDIVETDDCGDPPIPPRIGDEYQVSLLQLNEAFGSSKFPERSNQENGTGPADCSFGVGLDIPIYWVSVQKQGGENKTNFLQGSRGVAGAESTCLKNKEILLNPKDSSYSNSVNLHSNQKGSLPKAGCMNEVLDGSFSVQKKSRKRTSNHRRVKQRNYTPLPDRIHNSWSDLESGSFLLGLYIFGKNLSLVGRFMGFKGMGEMLSFYYGKFYRSDAYRRWSECRKSKSRKCIHGQRIFTGWRQQELMSRLLPNIPEESKNAFLETTQSFTEGTILFEEYVFQLRAIVGMKTLIEAIGIGKGKCDLTGIALDPAKTIIVPSFRPDAPGGKACSSLTSAEIVSFLTGDFRLSKARSYDLFWEAVWPRLLARGWHSEQPKNQRLPNSRPTLVFLVPGVKKFSRRKLLKGSHYYDSVADVLNKVASDPKLLELDVDGSLGENVSVPDWTVDEKSGTEHACNGVLSDIPRSTSELMKFTIVDTSLIPGETPNKIRDLRTLPMDSSYKYSNLSLIHNSSSSSDESETNSGNKSGSDEQPDLAEVPLTDREVIWAPHACGTSGKKTSILFGDLKAQSDHSSHILSSSSKGKLPKQISKYHHNLSNELPARDVFSESSRRAKPGKLVYLSPVSKRRRLTACKHPALGGIYPLSQAHQFNKIGIFGSLIACESVGGEPQQPLNKTSMSFSGKDSFNGSSDNAHSSHHSDDGNGIKASSLDDKSQPRALIDLNVPPDIDINETYSAEVSYSLHDVHINGNISTEVTQPSDDLQTLVLSKSSDFEQSTMGSRRHGTRNRPPTTRVLESLESGFFGLRRRAPSSRSLPSVTTKSSRRRRFNRETPQSLHTKHQDHVSIKEVGMGAKNVEEKALVSYPADPTCASMSEVMEHSGLMYNFLDAHEAFSTGNSINYHVS